MNKNTEYFYHAALKLCLNVEFNADIDGFVMILGKKRYFFFGLSTPVNNHASSMLARNKYATNKLLHHAGLPVPKATWIDMNQFKDGLLDDFMVDFKWPLVVKPFNGHLGEAVLCNIQNRQQLIDYMNEQFAVYPLLSIEEFHGNMTSYRVLVFKQQVIAVMVRYPATIKGDGSHNVTELIAIANKQRQEISDTLKPIVIDTECRIRLNELGIDASYIPCLGEEIRLCYTSNASRGGTYHSLGKSICRENRELFIKASKALNLDLVGFDVECQDIMLPIMTTGGVIIEANDNPSIQIHENPLSGPRVAICRKILKHFIYRHPLAYLYHLYINPRSALYFRSLLMALFMGLVYCVGFYGRMHY